MHVFRIEYYEDEAYKDAKAAAVTMTFCGRPDQVMAGAAALVSARPDDVMAEAAVRTDNLYINLYMPRGFAPQSTTSRQAPDFMWQ